MTKHMQKNSIATNSPKSIFHEFGPPNTSQNLAIFGDLMSRWVRNNDPQITTIGEQNVKNNTSKNTIVFDTPFSRFSSNFDSKRTPNLSLLSTRFQKGRFYKNQCLASTGATNSRSTTFKKQPKINEKQHEQKQHRNIYLSIYLSIYLLTFSQSP